MLAVVVAGLLLGHKAPILQTAQSRIAERMNWRTIAFLLENTVFLLIGLQARWILARRAGTAACPPAGSSSVCAATLVAVIVLRLVWVFPARYLLVRPGPDPETGQQPAVALHLPCSAGPGMRGVVTLAAAFVIPEDIAVPRGAAADRVHGGGRARCSSRGSTLPWLARRLRRARARPARGRAGPGRRCSQQASQAGLERLDEHSTTTTRYDIVEPLEAAARAAQLRRLGAARRHHATRRRPSEAYARLRLEMIDAERGKVLRSAAPAPSPHEVVERRAGRRSTSRSRCSTSASERRAELAGAETVSGVTGTTAPASTSTRRPRDVDADAPSGECEDCVARGLTTWVHLRMCLACGHIGLLRLLAAPARQRALPARPATR